VLLKIIFSVAGLAGVVAIFYVSWFWRALIIPMVILLMADVVVGLFKKS